MKIQLSDGEHNVGTVESETLLTAGSLIEVSGKKYVVQPELKSDPDGEGKIVTTQRVTLATEKGSIPTQELNE